MLPDYNETPAERMKSIERTMRAPDVGLRPSAGPLSSMGAPAPDPRMQALQAMFAQPAPQPVMAPQPAPNPFNANVYFADGGPVMPSSDPMGGYTGMESIDQMGRDPGAYEKVMDDLARMGAAAKPAVTALRGAGEIPGTVADYASEVTAGPDPSQRLGQDLGKLGSMFAEGVKADPLGALLDVTPVVGEIRSGMDANKYTRMAEEAEMAGDEPKAKTFRQLAAMAVAGAAPLIGTGARLAKRGAKAAAEGVEAGVEAGAKQAISSADTSINQVPALFKSKLFEAPEGARNLDIGGGKYDKGTDYLAAERGVESYVYDPFNRTPEHNKLVLDQFADNPADTVTAANVLNVIKEPEARLDVIQQAFDNLKPGGKAYFDIYEGSKSGVGKETTKGWQNNMKAADFQDEIAAVFPDVERKGSMLIATKAADEAAELSPLMQAFNDTPEPAALRDSVVSKIAQSIDESAGDTAKLPTVSGLGPQYIVDSGVEDVSKKQSFLLASTKNRNADKQLTGVASLLNEFPDMALDPEQWARGFAKATGERNVVAPPYRFMKAIADGEYTELLRGMTPGQISDADAGFAAGKDFLKAYHTGQMGVEDTGKMFMWGIMSRGVNPFTHEGLFLDAFNGIEPWIKMAAEGKFTKEIAEGAYKDWAATTAPKGSGQPGSGAMHNLNAFGKDFLLKMSQPDKTGVTPLQKLHDLMQDPSKSGRDIRREFARVGEGVGIDNKVVSFILLATGRDDVMVIDRIQLKNLWDDGRYADTNIWDGISVPTVTLKDNTVKRFAPTDDGRAAAKAFAEANPGAKGGTAVVTGSSLAEATYGAKGILIYEAIEDALTKNVGKIYSDLGRPNAASPGRFHWETWVARSNQEASHGTLPAILKKVQGANDPLAGVYSKQGDYQSYAYGAKYMRDAEGKPMFAIPLASGAEITMTPQQYQSALAQMRKPKYGVVPKNFKVTETEGMPWYEREGVNRSKLDAILRAAAGQEGAIRKAIGGPVSYGSGDRAGGRGTAGVEAPQAGVGLNQATQEVLSEIRQIADSGGLDQRKIAYLIRMSATGTFEPASAYKFAGEILNNDLDAIRERFAQFPRTLRILSRLDRALGGSAGRQYGVAANEKQDRPPVPLDGAAEGFAKGGKVKKRKPARMGSKGAMDEFAAVAERIYGAKVAKNILGRSGTSPTKLMFAMNQYAKNLMLSNPQRYSAGYKAQLRELNAIAKKYKIETRQAFNQVNDVEATKKDLNETLQSKPTRDNSAFADAIKRLLYILR